MIHWSAIATTSPMIDLHASMHILFQRLLMSQNCFYKLTNSAEILFNTKYQIWGWYIYLDYHKMYLQQQNMREAWYVDMQHTSIGFYCCCFLIYTEWYMFDKVPGVPWWSDIIIFTCFPRQNINFKVLNTEIGSSRSFVLYRTQDLTPSIDVLMGNIKNLSF